MVAVLGACGPDLTDPSPTDISGRWTSADTVGGVTDFVLVLSQAGDGDITGSWAGSGLVVDGDCVGELGCAPTNDVTGSNTVFQVHIDLLGLGPFTGQVESEVHFRGHLAGSPMVFLRAAEVQGARVPRGVP